MAQFYFYKAKAKEDGRDVLCALNVERVNYAQFDDSSGELHVMTSDNSVLLWGDHARELWEIIRRHRIED